MKYKTKGLLALLALGATTSTVISVANKYSKKLMYRHHKNDDRPFILETKYNCKNIYIHNHQNIKLHGIILEHENADTTVLIAHPFGLEAKDMALYVPYFKEHLPQANILLIDFCAHGQSDGYIRGFGIKDVQDIVLWNEYLIETYGKDHRILMYGKEAGANAIINAAGKHLLKNVVGIISDGAFTSPYDIIGYRIVTDYKISKFPVLPLIARNIKKSVFIDIKESTIQYAKHNDIPTLFFHTRKDEFVPLRMVYSLFNSNRGEKTLFVVKDEKYLYDLQENDEYKQTMAKFIESVLA